MPLLSPIPREIPPQVVEELLEPEVMSESSSNREGKLSQKEKIARVYAKKGLTIEAIAKKSADIFLYGEDHHLAMKIAERVLSLNGAGEEENATKTVPQITINFGHVSPNYSHQLMEVLVPE